MVGNYSGLTPFHSGMEKQNNQGKLLVQLGVKTTDIKIVTFSKLQYNPFFIVNVTVYDNWNI
jgi:hypothetical protein